MKCQVCRDKADIKVPRHKTAFCTKHYIVHIHHQIERAINKFKMFSKEEIVMLGVSGGKDSMALWKALIELGYNVQAVHINNRFGEFSEKSEAVVRKFAEENNADLKVYYFEELNGFNFKEALKYVNKPVCSLCGVLKRYALNRLAKELKCEVSVTAHNLDDEIAFLLGNILHWQMDYLKRQSPVLEAEPGMIKKVKPAIRVTDEELRKYVEVWGIDYIKDKCPYSVGATSHFYKNIMDQLETQYPGTKINFYQGFIKNFKTNLKEEVLKTKKAENYCTECGYKTIREDKCFVCSLKERIQNGGKFKK